MERDNKSSFGKLSIKNTANIFYKQEPMAQIAAVIKKLKKNKKTKPSELAEMYNEKCVSLCEQIETNKLEIENYKTIIFGLQKTLVDKDKEIETLKLDLIKEKELINEGEEKIKNLSLNINIPNVDNNPENKEEKEKKDGKEEKEGKEGKEEKDEIDEEENEGKDEKEEMIQKLQNKIIILNKEKNEFNLKMLDKENDYKIYLKQKDEKIEELMKILKEKEDKIQEIMNQYNNLNNNLLINEEKNEKEEKKEEKKEENNEENKSENIKDLKDIEVEVPKQETDEHKLMIYNKVMSENLFMIYLLERSPNYGKIIKELINNFDKYANIFIRDNLKVNNIFSNVLYEFLYRSYRRTDLDEFATEIYDNNSISRSEDFKEKILENEFYTKGFINEFHINELNKKIKQYKIDTLNDIKKLVSKFKVFIRDTEQLENVRKFEPSNLYSFNKSRLKINLTYLNPNTIGFLVTSIKYITDKIKSVEFSGELNYDRNEECKYTHEVFYQLLTSHGEEIKDLFFTGIKKFSPYKLLSLSYSTNIFIKGINILLQGCPKIKNIYVNFCEITDDHIADFEFQSNYKYSIINFSNNKIYKLKSFEKIVTTQLILNHNKIKFYQGDNNLSFTYLDLSANDISLKDFNRYMNDCKVQMINLSDIRIAKEDEGMQISNALGSMRELKIIYLNNCQLQERSLKPILNSIYKSEILELYLVNNPLGDECMKIVSEFIRKCHTLLKIDLSNTKITTDGMQQIVEGVADNDSIKEINAENNPMLDKVKAIEMFKFKEKFKINI